ncbi:MAG: aspartate carbamoyltransferase [Clostridia bacterium]|nr:aspartate carbamoyltransferase [Clostridia bacterium]
MKSVVDILDLSKEELASLMATAMDIAAHPEKYSDKCKGKKLASLFFEPSTRTRLSFEAAMMELGGNVIGFAEERSSSVAKGESIADTVKIISLYADIIAMRTPKEGSALVAAMNSDIPVINAGDGGHSHPTQTLADLLTIYKEKGRLDNLTVGFCGDLKYGRTVHSLIAALSRYTSVKAVLISPDELRIPNYVKYEILEKNGVEYVETHSLEEAIPSLDVLYMTRIQRERFSDPSEYDRLKDTYILNPEKLINARRDMIILHPLPRVNEISVKIDSDPRACYFKQALNGKHMRMALILMLLDEAAKNREREDLLAGKKLVYNKYRCIGQRCITATEQELEHIFKEIDPERGIYRCIYCEKKAVIAK